MSDTRAIPATAQGTADAKLRCAARLSAPAGAPQRWQNLAPGVNGALHEPQVAPASGAPQFEQKLPVETVPHEAQPARVSGVASGFGAASGEGVGLREAMR